MERNEVMNGTADRLKNAGSEVVGTVQDASRQVYDATKRAAREAADSSKQALSSYSEEGKKQLANVETYVRDNPVRSVLMSAAAGFILSRFFRS